MPLSKNQTSAVADIPQDVDGLLRLAAQSMFDVLARSTEGMMVIDRHHRVVWISDGYKRFLPALGFADEQEFVGRPVEDVVPNTQMLQVLETGKPVLVDLLTNRAGTFLVSRLPLRNDAGEVIGALGLVLLDHPETTMQPLIQKFGRLQQELEDTRRQLAAEVSAKRRPKYTIASFIGASPAALEVKRQARRVAQTDSTVLLLGETGTGKELMAHAIHSASRRAHRPLVGVNIAAVPETLLEAEFFGVSPGAYTGADRKGRDGKFKLADGGTLFLDEIGDLPLAMQSKLLRVIQERSVRPVGATAESPVNVRILSATHKDLGAEVAAGRFRQDLFYRLNVIQIRVPPLRERLEDLGLISNRVLARIAQDAGVSPTPRLTAGALQTLSRYAFPGNVRELENLLHRALALAGGEWIDADDLGLPDALLDEGRSESQFAALDTPLPVAPVSEGLSLPEQLPSDLARYLDEVERAILLRALEQHRFNRTAAAASLGLSLRQIRYRMARLAISAGES